VRSLLVPLTFVFAVACGDSASSSADASVAADATAPRPDATTGNPDAATTNPDATAGNPDAATTNPDATAGNPDAATTNPDATAGNPDAATTNPDASVADAAGFPDAAVLPGNCSGTLSGALTGTFTCSVQAVFGSMDGESGFAINALTLPANVLALALGGTVTGQLAAKTYNVSDFVEVGASVATMTGGYVMDSSAPTGTAQVVLSSVSVQAMVGNDIAYTVHGSATATLVASGGSATVTMTVTF